MKKKLLKIICVFIFCFVCSPLTFAAELADEYVSVYSKIEVQGASFSYKDDFTPYNYWNSSTDSWAVDPENPISFSFGTLPNWVWDQQPQTVRRYKLYAPKGTVRVAIGIYNQHPYSPAEGGNPYGNSLYISFGKPPIDSNSEELSGPVYEVDNIADSNVIAPFWNGEKVIRSAWSATHIDFSIITPDGKPLEKGCWIYFNAYSEQTETYSFSQTLYVMPEIYKSWYDSVKDDSTQWERNGDPVYSECFSTEDNTDDTDDTTTEPDDSSSSDQGTNYNVELVLKTVELYNSTQLSEPTKAKSISLVTKNADSSAYVSVYSGITDKQTNQPFNFKEDFKPKEDGQTTMSFSVGTLVDWVWEQPAKTVKRYRIYVPAGTLRVALGIYNQYPYIPAAGGSPYGNSLYARFGSPPTDDVGNELYGAIAQGAVDIYSDPAFLKEFWENGKVLRAAWSATHIDFSLSMPDGEPLKNGCWLYFTAYSEQKEVYSFSQTLYVDAASYRSWYNSVADIADQWSNNGDPVVGVCYGGVGIQPVVAGIEDGAIYDSSSLPNITLSANVDGSYFTGYKCYEQGTSSPSEYVIGESVVIPTPYARRYLLETAVCSDDACSVVEGTSDTLTFAVAEPTSYFADQKISFDSSGSVILKVDTDNEFTFRMALLDDDQQSGLLSNEINPFIAFIYNNGLYFLGHQDIKLLEPDLLTDLFNSLLASSYAPVTWPPADSASDAVPEYIDIDNVFFSTSELMKVWNTFCPFDFYIGYQKKVN